MLFQFALRSYEHFVKALLKEIGKGHVYHVVFKGFREAMTFLLLGQHVISCELLIDFISEKLRTLLLGVRLVKRQHASALLT